MESQHDYIASSAVDRHGRIDLPAVLEQFGGLREVLDEVIAAYLDQYPPMLADVSRAVAARDSAALARSAHRFKGAVSIFGVDAATEPVTALERAGRTGDLEHIDDMRSRMEVEVERLGNELRSLLPVSG